MNLRAGFYLLCSVLCLSLISSCLGDNDETEYLVSTDAEILTFGLSSDSISAIDSVVFSIDQLNGLIYNNDSMDYGTDIYEKVTITYASAAGYTNVLNVTNVAKGDSTWIASGDSIDVTNPVRLKVFAPDGITVKYYWMSLNIHQVDPDSIQYARVAQDLAFLSAEEIKTVLFKGIYYTYAKNGTQVSLNQSTDVVHWTPGALNGLPGTVALRGIQSGDSSLYAFTGDGELYVSSTAVSWQKIATAYPVKTVLGYLKASPTQVAGLALVVEKEGKWVYAFTPDLTTWAYGVELPSDFPVTDFSSISLTSMIKERVTIIGGISQAENIQNSSWSTTNGLYWAKLTDAEQGLFPKTKGANAFLCGDEIYILNGQASDGSYSDQVYLSVDGGATWKLCPEKCSLPEGYANRYSASVVSDTKGVNFYIVGGRNSVAQTDIWRGLLNKSAFNK